MSNSGEGARRLAIYLGGLAVIAHAVVLLVLWNRGVSGGPWQFWLLLFVVPAPVAFFIPWAFVRATAWVAQGFVAGRSGPRDGAARLYDLARRAGAPVVVLADLPGDGIQVDSSEDSVSPQDGALLVSHFCAALLRRGVSPTMITHGLHRGGAFDDALNAITADPEEAAALDEDSAEQ